MLLLLLDRRKAARCINSCYIWPERVVTTVSSSSFRRDTCPIRCFLLSPSSANVTESPIKPSTSLHSVCGLPVPHASDQRSPLSPPPLVLREPEQSCRREQLPVGADVVVFCSLISPRAERVGEVCEVCCVTHTDVLLSAERYV